MDFKNKRAWITGGSSGIGEELAYELTRLGSKLIISSNDAEELSKVQSKCMEMGGECDIVPFDLSNPEEVSATADAVIERFGKVDLFFSNGGISTRSLVTETTMEVHRKIMEINYFSGIAITRKLLPVMLENGGGYIAATASIAGDFGFPLRSAYSASKHAVYGFYETVRAELKQQGIGVTVVSPGRVQTKISMRALDKDGKPHGKMDAGQAGGITANKCAQKIIKAIRKNKPVAYIGGKELLMVYVKRFFPRIFFRIVSKIDPT